MSKKTVKLNKSTTEWNIASVILLAVFFMTLVNQGGFYEGAIAFAGLFLSCFLFAKKIKVEFSVSNGLLALFSLWYFICSFKNGFVTEYAVRGLLPFVLLIFSVYASSCSDKRAQLISLVLKFSLCLALFAILQCVVLTVKNGSFIRLLFPFNYSNASGIYFSACFFLCLESNDRFLKKASPVFVLSTLLTMSVGAISLSLILFSVKLVRKKKIKEFIVLLLVTVVAAVLLKNRIIQSGGTFLERILHMHDGILCMTKNPIFGIGAGAWENAKQIYQTGFYSAILIHSSFVQIGVNSGFLGLLLFVLTALAFLKDAFLNKKYFAVCLLILIHSLFDFSLSFSAILFLLIVLSAPETKRKYEIKKTVKYIAVCLSLCLFIVSAFGLYSVKEFQNKPQREINIFVSHSTQAAKSYASYMNAQKRTVPKDLFCLRHKPYELVINEALGEEELITALQNQPYNVKLMRFIEENCSIEYIEKARLVRKKALASLSPAGEILYNLKGENQ